MPLRDCFVRPSDTGMPADICTQILRAINQCIDPTASVQKIHKKSNPIQPGYGGLIIIELPTPTSTTFWKGHSKMT